MAAQVRRGDLVLPDEDDQAAKYELADEVLTAAGLTWYEVSNWARSEGTRCRHNLGYWRGDEWWGIGPGAHSYIGPGPSADPQHAGVRWWNAKHPRRYAELLEAGHSPAAGRELLDSSAAGLEAVLLGVRLAEGLDLRHVPSRRRPAVARMVSDGLLDGRAAIAGRGVLTPRGRLLADTVVRALTE